MQGIWRAQGMFTRIPGSLLEESGKCYYFDIPGNSEEDSGEYSRRFPGNAQEDSRECWQRFSRMLKKIEHFIMQLNENRIKGYIIVCKS